MLNETSFKELSHGSSQCVAQVMAAYAAIQLRPLAIFILVRIQEPLGRRSCAKLNGAPGRRGAGIYERRTKSPRCSEGPVSLADRVLSLSRSRGRLSRKGGLSISSSSSGSWRWQKSSEAD